MTNAKLSKYKAGFTLVELGIVIAIAAIIIGVGLAVVPNLMATTRANAEARELPVIAVKIRTLYNGATLFTGISASSLAPLNIWDPSVVTLGTPNTIVNRWGGAVTVAATTLGVSGDGFSISSTNVPRAECVQISQSEAGNARVIYGGTGGATLIKADGVSYNPTSALSCATTNTMIYSWGK